MGRVRYYFVYTRRRISVFMNSPAVDALVAAISACYLLIVTADLALDELLNAEDAVTLEDYMHQEQVIQHKDEVRRCIEHSNAAHRHLTPVDALLQRGGCRLCAHILTRRCLQVMVKIDLAFLFLFLVEIALKALGQGWSYLLHVGNVADLFVVVTGLLIDLLVITNRLGEQLIFIRLGRVLRVARITTTLSRLAARRRLLRQMRGQGITKVATPPKCNWKQAKSTATKKPFAAFLSHAKVRGSELQRPPPLPAWGVITYADCC